MSNCPPYNENDTLCTCMHLKHKELKPVAKKHTNVESTMRCTGAGTVCNACVPLLEEMCGQQVWQNIQKMEIGNISNSVISCLLYVDKIETVQPGQFVTIQAYINDRWVTRRYTIVHFSLQKKFYKIAIKKLDEGLFSTWIHNEETDKKYIRISKPMGEAISPKNDSNKMVFFVAGIGVTPAISYLKTKDVQNPVEIIHCISKDEERIFADELFDFSKNNENITVQFHIASKQGRLENKEVKKIVKEHPDSTFVLCGPGMFNEQVKRYLKNNAIQDAQILPQSFTSSGTKNVQSSKAYVYIGLLLFFLFLVQDFFGLKIPTLEAWQADGDYRIYSGLFVLAFIGAQFIRPYNKACEFPHVKASTFRNHKILGAFAPLVFFVHSSSFGVGYLLFLSIIYFSNFLVGMFNYEHIQNAQKRIWYYPKWLFLHIVLSILSLAFIALHIYVVGAY